MSEIPSVMRAVLLTGHGSLDKLLYREDVPVPRPTDLHNYNTVSTGHPGPRTEGGRLYASDTPGLGVEPAFDVLGDPVAVIT